MNQGTKASLEGDFYHGEEERADVQAHTTAAPLAYEGGVLFTHRVKVSLHKNKGKRLIMIDEEIQLKTVGEVTPNSVAASEADRPRATN